MPELDPAWEYFVADPEIDEVIRESGEKAKAFDRLDYHVDGNFGMRVGAPDSAPFRVPAPKKPDDRFADDQKKCLACKHYFTLKPKPTTRPQRYCGVFCFRNRFKLKKPRKNAKKKERSAPKHRIDMMRELIRRRVPRDTICKIMGISVVYYYILRPHVKFKGRYKRGRKDPLKYPIKEIA